MKNDLAYLVRQLLLQHKIAIDNDELIFQIESHPSYPSLHAVTGVLDHFNIDNVALDIPQNKETLDQLPNSFLAQIELQEGKEFVIAYKNDLQYTLLDVKKKKSKLSINEFLKKFTGIIVAVEKKELIEDSRPKNFAINNILLASFSLLVLCLFMLSKPTLVSALFLFTSVIGIYIGLTLKKQEQGESTILGNAFCSSQTENTDCNAVLASKGANVFGAYKLSDISAIYFTGLSLTVFLLTLIDKNLSIPYIVSLLAFPVTIYSIYYQYAILKKWCLLCLTVVALLSTQAVLVAFSFKLITYTSISLNNFLTFGFSFLLTIIMWNIFFSNFKELAILKKNKINHFKFKRNFKLFNTLLNSSNPINTTIKNISEIVFGNELSPLQLTIITNPYCGHCKETHELVETILKKYNQQIKICIRFNVETLSESDAVKITSRLIEIYHQSGQTKCLEAMHHIYNGQSPQLWINQFGRCNNKTYYINILKRESSWCKDNDINFTPELLINGNSYPKEYDKKDLLYFIDELYENCFINTEELQLTT